MKRLTVMRILDGKKMSELADIVGVDKSTIYRWEHGLVDPFQTIGIDGRRRLASYYNRSLVSLFEDIKPGDVI